VRDQDCRAKIERLEDGNKKPDKFLKHVCSPQNQLHLGFALVKQKLVIDPIMQAAERGSHCSAPILCGPFGVVAMTRRQLMRSVVRLDLGRMLAKERRPELGLGAGERPQHAERAALHRQLESTLKGALVLGSDLQPQADARVRGARGGAFSLPATLLLPRWDVWAPVLRLAVGRRPKPRADGATPPESFGASQRWRCHIAKTIVRWVEATLVEFEERLGRLITRVECMIPAVTLEYEPTPDGRLVALAPLEARARPSITTPLQQRVADLVVAKFDALTDNERAAYPLAIRRLLTRDGELRTALDEFRAQPFRKRAAVRNWPSRVTDRCAWASASCIGSMSPTMASTSLGRRLASTWSGKRMSGWHSRMRTSSR
jgi:hypothetical protein